MCVIFLATDKRPTPSMVDRAYDTNGSGAGIAWRHQDEGKPLVVRWVKGLKREEIQKLVAEAPLPFVCHFRIPTCGGAIPELTHPFPIAKNTSLSLEGSTKGFVLFHNGHWGRWKDESLKAALEHKLTIPAGKWSDSRAMAWTAAHFGVNILEFIDEKCIAFGPQDVEIYGSGWSKEEDVWVSNKHWVGGNYYTHGTTYRSKICKWGSCKAEKHLQTDYCFEHQDKDPSYKPAVLVKDEPSKGKLRGASQEMPFRGGSDPLRRGAALTQEVQTGAATLAETSETSSGTPEGEEVEGSSSSESFPRSFPRGDASSASLRFARSFNPKRFHTATLAIPERGRLPEEPPVLTGEEVRELRFKAEEASDRIERAAKHRSGITILGPM